VKESDAPPARTTPWARRRFLVLAVAGLALGVVLMLLTMLRSAPGQRDTVPPVAAAAAMAARAPAAPVGDATAAAADTPAETVVAGAAARPAAEPAAGWLARLQRPLEPKPATVVVDLCGIGRMPVPGLRMPAGAPLSEVVEKLPDALGLHPMREAWAQVRDALIARGGTDRAWALALEASGGMTGDGQQADGWGRGPATQAAMAALAEQARTSTDAIPLRLALGSCELRPTSSSPSGASAALGDAGVDAACQALDPSRLADLDPSDAHGWLLRASAAAGPEIRREALEQAAAAPRLTGLFFHAPRVVADVWPAERPAYLRLELVVRAIGVAAAIESMDVPLAAMRFCRDNDGNAAGDRAADRALCDRLARLFLERSNTAQLAMFGNRIGAMAGWPEAEVASTRQTLEGLVAASIGLIVGEMVGGASPWSCANIAAMDQHFAASVRDGELSALRALQAVQRTPQMPPPAGDAPPRR
jgi:hypothetical protein